MSEPARQDVGQLPREMDESFYEHLAAANAGEAARSPARQSTQ